jgi:hypothetical protein
LFLSQTQSFFLDVVPFFLTSEFFPVIEFSLFGKNGIAFCEVIDAEFIFGAENIVETVVNVGVFRLNLKRRFGKLSRLRLDLNVTFPSVHLLMLQLVLIHVIDLIQFFALELLRLHQWVNEPGLIGQWLNDFLIHIFFIHNV